MPEVGFEPTCPKGHWLLRAIASASSATPALPATIAAAAGDNPPPVDVAERMEIIRELCSFEGRLAGTDAERRAANWLAERLRELGRRVEVEPTYVHPQCGRSSTPPTACSAFAGSLVAISIPALGFALVLVAATSMYLDLNGRFYLLRSLFFRRASQNVVSPGPRPTAPARADPLRPLRRRPQRRRLRPRPRPRASPGSRRARRSRSGRFGSCSGRWRFCCRCSALRMAGIDSDAGRGPPAPPHPGPPRWRSSRWSTIELSEVVPGANDNASGVATALSLAAELDAEPPENLDVWVVLDGGEECLQEGMRAFVRSRRKRARPRDHLLHRARLGRRRRRPLRDRRRLGGQLRDGPPPGRALRGDRHRRRRDRRPLRAPPGSRAGSAATIDAGAAGRVSSAWASPASTTTATPPNRHLPTDTPDADRPRRPRPCPRLRARAGPPPRRRSSVAARGDRSGG